MLYSMQLAQAVPQPSGAMEVMGRRLVSKRECCCWGSLLSYRIGALLTSQGLAVSGWPMVGGKSPRCAGGRQHGADMSKNNVTETPHSHHKETYESAVTLKRQLHSQYVGLSTGRLLARQWGDWVTVTEHWQEVAWREKGQYLESELAALRVLQLKRRRPLSPDVRVCKRRCLHPPPVRLLSSLQGHPTETALTSPSLNSLGPLFRRSTSDTAPVYRLCIEGYTPTTTFHPSV